MHDETDTRMLASVRKYLLEKSGLLCESRTAATFWDNGWWVSTNLPFRDPETDTMREIDVRATYLALHDEPRPPHPYQPPGSIGVSDDPSVTCLVECSRSSKPWVFFLGSEGVEAGHYSIPTPDMLLTLGIDPLIVDMAFERSTHLRPGAIARSWDVAHGSAGKDEIFDALTKATKAATAEMDEELSLLGSQGSQFDLAGHLILPVVVVDGPLVAAQYSREGDLRLEETGALSVAFAHKLRGEIGCTAVEVTTLDHLPTAIVNIRRRARQFFESVDVAEALARSRPLVDGEDSTRRPEKDS